MQLKNLNLTMSTDYSRFIINDCHTSVKRDHMWNEKKMPIEKNAALP